MDENENEVIDSTNDTEETVNDEALEVEIEDTEETKDTEDENTEVDDVESLKKQVQTLQAQKEHWRNKAKGKVETPNTKQEVSNKNIEQLSTIDTIAIMKADIDTDDIPKVVEMAKLKGVTVAEALKSKSVQAILQESKEERLTANATNVASSRRSSSRVSDETLIERAKKGIMPDNDADLERLILADLAKK